MFVKSKYEFFGQGLERWISDKNASILVVGAGKNDREVLKSRGYRNVILTDLDDRGGVNEGGGYRWVREDAEDLSFSDREFDFVICNSLLHHCASPHRALLEMFRVARIGVIVLEARDSLLIRCAERLGLALTYEIPAVQERGGVSGGVRNLAIPNYVYRWTEREVKKTISSFSPEAKHGFEFSYAFQEKKIYRIKKFGRIGNVFTGLIKNSLWILMIVFPLQQNLFLFFVRKGGKANIQPWLKIKGEKILFNMQYKG